MMLPPSALDAIPQELKDRPQWVAWRYEMRNGKRTKVPYQDDGKKAKSNDPTTWMTFERAVRYAAVAGVDGIGFVFSADDPYVGVDLDHVRLRDPAGGITDEWDSWAVGTIAQLNSYTEVSPSGDGTHTILRGTLPPHGRKKGNFECYSSGRFFTFTGNVWQGIAKPIATDRNDDLQELHREVFGEQPTHTAAPATPSTSDLPDEEVITRCLARSETFRYLFLGGDISRYNAENKIEQGQNEADAALINAIYNVNGCDVEQADRIYRQSPLMRDKWDEPHSPTQTFGEMTLAFCLTNRSDAPHLLLKRRTPIPEVPPLPKMGNEHTPEDVRRYIAELEAALAAAKKRQAEADEYIAQLEEENAALRSTRRRESNVFKNPKIKSVALPAVKLVETYTEQIRRRKVDADGWAPVFMGGDYGIGAACGRSGKVVGAAVQQIAGWDIGVERAERIENGRTHVYVRFTEEPAEVLKKLATFEPPPVEKADGTVSRGWGGYAGQPCKDHPHADIIRKVYRTTRWYCGECHAELHHSDPVLVGQHRLCEHDEAEPVSQDGYRAEEVSTANPTNTTSSPVDKDGSFFHREPEPVQAAPLPKMGNEGMPPPSNDAEFDALIQRNREARAAAEVPQRFIDAFGVPPEAPPEPPPPPEDFDGWGPTMMEDDF